MSGPDSKSSAERILSLFSLKRETVVTTDIDAYLKESEKDRLKDLIESEAEHGRVGYSIFFKRLWKDDEHFELICRQHNALFGKAKELLALIVVFF